MRKHIYKVDKKTGLSYHTVTAIQYQSDITTCLKDVTAPLYKKQYVSLLSLFESRDIDSIPIKINCKCGNIVRLPLDKKLITVLEPKSNVVGIFSLKPRQNKDDNFINCIESVLIDGDYIEWDQCSNDEKNTILESVDYETFKEIEKTLSEYKAVFYYPIDCECGITNAVTLGFDKILKVMYD